MIIRNELTLAPEGCRRITQVRLEFLAVDSIAGGHSLIRTSPQFFPRIDGKRPLHPNASRISYCLLDRIAAQATGDREGDIVPELCD